MKDKIFRIIRKAALPAMLAAALTIPVGAFAEEHGHFGGEHARGGVYRGGHDFDHHDFDHDRDHRYYRGGLGGGVYFGGAPYYGYGYAAPAPAPACGYYDQYGNWIATACAVPPYGY
jgi:hypothetical protein